MPSDPSHRMTSGTWSAGRSAGRPVLFVNPRSGGGKAARAGLAEHARALGIRVRGSRAGERPRGARAREISGGADALGIAGGDGSLAVVAAAASAHDLPFVCVPAGTATISPATSALPATISLARSPRSRRPSSAASTSATSTVASSSTTSRSASTATPSSARATDAKARTLLQTAAQVLGPSAAPAGLEIVDDRDVSSATRGRARVEQPVALGPPQRGDTIGARHGRLGDRRPRPAGRPPHRDAPGRPSDSPRARPAPSPPVSTAKRSSSLHPSSGSSGPARSASGSPRATRGVAVGTPRAS